MRADPAGDQVFPSEHTLVHSLIQQIHVGPAHSFCALQEELEPGAPQVPRAG